MSLAVSFQAMIHLKSTLAISAIMLTGLVVASPFPYAGDHEPKRPQHTVSAQVAPAIDAAKAPATVTAWADPPAKMQISAEQPVQAAFAEPAAPVAVPSAAAAPVVAPPPGRSMSAQARAEQARRRKLARAARDRQIAQKPPAPDTATETRVASRTAPNVSQKIDPIGDILRGLGIGKES